MASPKFNNLADLARAATSATTGKRSSGGREVLSVPLDDVVPKDQVRKNFRNIEELAQSIKAEGQQSPIIVYPKNKEGKYVIQKGERRWRALKLTDISTIDLIVNDKNLTDLEETAGELIENIQREDLEPLEIANALQLFINQGWEQQKIAERLGKSPVYISRHVSLLQLPDCVRVLYEEEVCRDVDALNTLRVLFQENADACKAFCAAALAQGTVSRKAARDALQDARRQAKTLQATSSDSEVAGAGLDPISTAAADAFLDDAEQDDVENVEAGLEDGPEQVDPEADEKLLEKAQQEWRPAKADSLLIAVEFETKGEMKRGVLVLNRVSPEPQMVWVKTLNKDKEIILKVPAATVRLVSIES